MLGIRPASQVLAAIALGLAGLSATGAAAAATVPTARPGDTTLCDFQAAPVSGGAYTVQNDEWGSSADECVTTSGGSDFTVANSTIDNATDGAPGGYPSIYAGCHWGDCTAGTLATRPPPVAAIGPASLTSSWAVSVPAGSAPAGGGNAYDVAYDIWINQTPTTADAANGTEIMVWLADQGPVQPAGSVVASGVLIGGRRYDVWYQPGDGAASVVTYQMTSQVSVVKNLNLGRLILAAERDGYTSARWYLISVEAGFEIWQGGTGLATTSFSVRLATSWRPTPPGSGSPTPPGAQPYHQSHFHGK